MFTNLDILGASHCGVYHIFTITFTSARGRPPQWASRPPVPPVPRGRCLGLRGAQLLRCAGLGVGVSVAIRGSGVMAFPWKDLPFTRPGKLSHNYGNWSIYSWSSYFEWWFSSLLFVCKYQAGYLLVQWISDWHIEPMCVSICPD